MCGKFGPVGSSLKPLILSGGTRSYIHAQTGEEKKRKKCAGSQTSIQDVNKAFSLNLSEE